MALPEVTYHDYEDWGGRQDREGFERALPHATAAVRHVIGFNVPEDDFQTAAYRKAVCAACDVDAAHGFSGGTDVSGGGFTIGSFSMRGGATGNAAGGAYDSDMARAIRRELVATGLLYQGIG